MNTYHAYEYRNKVNLLGYVFKDSHSDEKILGTVYEIF